MPDAGQGSARDVQWNQQTHGVQMDAVVIPMPREAASGRMPVQMNALYAPAVPNGKFNRGRYLGESGHWDTINAILPHQQQPHPAIIRL